jgi:hypothetical protein
MWETGELHAGFYWGNLRDLLFVRPRCSWEDNFKMDLEEVGW